MKYAFNLETRVWVEADDLAGAIAALARFNDFRDIDDRWAMVAVNSYQQVRACTVCGCTADDTCATGCEWVAWDLCSTDNVAHLAALTDVKERAVWLEPKSRP